MAIADVFVEELRQKKYDIEQQLIAKKSEFSRLSNEQQRLTALINSEKQTNSSSKQKKHKHHTENKEIRLDIVRNEQKHKEQAKKLDELKHEIHHIEAELKSTVHDLSVVER